MSIWGKMNFDLHYIPYAKINLNLTPQCKSYKYRTVEGSKGENRSDFRLVKDFFTRIQKPQTKKRY